MDDDRVHYFNGTGWLAIFTGTATMIGRTVDVDAETKQQALPWWSIPRRGVHRGVQALEKDIRT
ncbi:hypothetical protein AB0L67_33720 [Streptomyces flaveolus]|uniref:hypothetical protein n=1 Tax=Streptomyces flaveolus TaxID=67297 RepID=UPI003412CE25